MSLRVVNEFLLSENAIEHIYRILIKVCSTKFVGDDEIPTIEK